MRNLAHVSLPKNRMSAREELNQMRTLQLPAIIKESASAEFDVLLVGGKIEKVNFVSGSESLRSAGESLRQTSFEEPLPPSSTAHLLRSRRPFLLIVHWLQFRLLSAFGGCKKLGLPFGGWPTLELIFVCAILARRCPILAFFWRVARGF